MKTRKLRLLSALLALAMLFALMPTAAFADDSTENNIITYDCGENGNDVTATLNTVTGVMTISGSGAMGNYDYDRDHHTTTTPWDSKRKEITKVVIEGGVTSIGDNAFSDCANLESVDLSGASSLKTIGSSFYDCTKLDGVKLYEGLETIGGSAFNHCTSLGSIHIPSTVKEIGGWCFESCKSLSEVTFAKDINLTTIGEATFIYCSNLKKIVIPKSVEKIQTDENNHGAFRGCSGLESVTFEPGSGLTTVDWNAFYGCGNMKIYYSDEDANVKTALTNGNVAAGKIKSLAPTVTFDVDGTVFAKQNAKDNGFKARKPENPTKKGYAFTGWYTKNADNEYKPFDFNTTIMDNITLYAQWEEVPVDTYVVTVENGVAWVEADAETEAVAAGESICVPEGATVHVKADETAFDGMAFERWEVRKGEVKLENDRAAETTFTMPAGEVQLEAMPRLESPDDSGWDAATVVTGAVIGTGTAILAYHIGMEVYAEQVLGKGVAVPRTRGEVALLAWQLAGSPAVNVEGEPLSEAAQAERWAVESGLMQPDAEGNFNGTKKMSKWNALRTLDAAKKMG